MWFITGVVLLLVTNLLSIAIAHSLEGALGELDVGGSRDAALRWIGWLLASSVGIVFARTASRLAIFIPGREAEFELRVDYLRALLRQSAPFFRRVNAGDLLSRGSNDIQFIRALIGFAGLQILNIAFAVPLNLWMMLETSVWLTVYCVVPLALAVIVMFKSAAALMLTMRQSQEELALLSGSVLETVTGVRAIQAFGAERFVVDEVARSNARYVSVLERMAGIRSFLLPVVGVVGSLAVVLLIAVGGRMVARQELHYGSITAYTVYVANVVAAFTGLGWVISVLQRGQISLTRVFQILDEPEPADGALAFPEGGAPALRAQGLSFAYDPEQPHRQSLRNVAFDLPGGSRLGIFGATGSGKSTLLRLLARLDDAPPGTLFVGDCDITTIRREALRARMAVVPQTAWLFGRSLEENVVLGRPGAEPAEMHRALRLAAMDQDAARLPEGTATVVGERGVTLSGGQRQRVAIARALVRAGWAGADGVQPSRVDAHHALSPQASPALGADGAAPGARLVLLDDALSAVDHDAERRLVDMLSARGGEATVVIASHRVSVLRRCDYVLVLEGGQVAAFGPPAVLERGTGAFAEACRTEG